MSSSTNTNNHGHSALPEGEEQHTPPAPSRPTMPSTEVREPIPEFEEEVHLRDYLDVVLRRKWLVVCVLLVTFVSTLIISLAMRPVFKASGTMEISQKAPQVTNFEQLAASEMRSQEFLQTQVKLMQQAPVADGVIEQLDLRSHPVFNPPPEEDADNFVQSWLKQAKQAVSGVVASILGGRQEETAPADPGFDHLKKKIGLRDKYLNSLEVSPQRETNLVTVAYESSDPRLASRVVNTHMQEFIDWRMDKKIESSQTANRQLDRQVDQARIQLEKSREELNAYAQKAGIISLDSRLNQVYKQLEEINAALAKAEKDRVIAEAQYEQARKGDLSSLPEVMNNELIQQLKGQYADLQGRYQELLSTFKPEYPDLKNLKARMDDIEARIEEEKQSVLSSLRSEYESAQEREARLSAKAKEKKQLALNLNDKVTQYSILKQEVSTNEQIYQSLLDRSKEIHANVGTELPNLQVVSAADRPILPFKPNVRRNLLLAIVLGLMLGVGLAFFLEYLDNTVKKIEEITDRFNIPMLAVAPEVAKAEQQELDRYITQHPKSSFSESIRSARTAIQLSSFDQPPKSLVVTSSTPAQGKSTLALNLAQAFAAAEERVILLECDLRKPRLYKLFTENGSKSKGLSNYLSNLCSLQEVIHTLDGTNLKIIPSGSVPPNPTELLSSKRMRSFLAKLEEKFDRVILDAPPFTGFADALVLSNQVGGVVLVANLGETERETLRIFSRSMHNVQAQILGCIVNKMNTGYRYGGYYYRYYKYNYYKYNASYGVQEPGKEPAVQS
ncbi:MAG: polysaccharide biosynthesis tyrosine autokinase [Desulfohalobiaceae bacterium]|nr:polysaccharide biosynthesis tyrosine autokinase [Desulfohalobiaceae bacterium]